MNVESILSKLKEEPTEKPEPRADGYEPRGNRNGYSLFMKMEDGRGKWLAEKNGNSFPITWAQAVGHEPIDDAEKLSMWLGARLMPR